MCLPTVGGGAKNWELGNFPQLSIAVEYSTDRMFRKVEMSGKLKGICSIKIV